jgi:selenocysteine-specific translation elongation factor
VGKIATGSLKIGDEIRCPPSKQPFRVITIENNHQEILQAFTGDYVGLALNATQSLQLKKGSVITSLTSK